MINNYAKIAFRNILKYKAYSAINISGLAIGMAAFILILLFVRNEVGYDKFHSNLDQLYRIITVADNNGQELQMAITPSPLAASLKDKYPEIINAVSYVYRYNDVIEYKNKLYTNHTTGFSDPSFWDMFSFPVLKGNTDAINNAYSIMISDRMAVQIFGTEDPIGKTILYCNEYDMTVTGVFMVPDNSNLQFDIFASKQFYGTLGNVDLETWGNYTYMSYLQLHKGSDINKLSNAILNHMGEASSNSNKIILQPYSEMYLHSHYQYDHIDKGDSGLINTMIIVAIVILAMAAINFINLSTARSEKRIKEVGLRKVVGAYRRQLISQFLCEAVSVSFIALAISMILISIVLPHFNNLTAKKLILFQHGDISIFLILIFTALLTGLLAGSYPAIYLSSFNPAKILKGTITRTPKAGNLRKIFVITQFAASIILIISTLVINKQVDFIKTRDPGYKKDNLLYFRMNDSIKTQYTAIKHQLLQNPEIQNVSQCYYLPNWHGPSVNLREWEGKTDDKEIMLYYLSADFDYISTMGMTINQGRDFSETFTSDTQSNIIVNMEAVRQLGMEDPVGKNVNISGSDLRIIGVVNNFNIENIRNKINPFAIFIQPSQARYALLRIKSDNINHLLDDIKESVAEFEGDFPVDIRFMDDMLDSMYRLEMTSVKIVCSFSILAIIISCLGLFGLTAFIAEKRTKEIGIRKTLGASASSIIILLSRQFALLMVVASLIAYPAAYYLSAAWLQNYAFKTRISIDLFIIAGLATIGITVVTVVFQSMKAAYANPLKALRIE